MRRGDAAQATIAALVIAAPARRGHESASSMRSKPRRAAACSCSPGASLSRQLDRALLRAVVRRRDGPDRPADGAADRRDHLLARPARLRHRCPGRPGVCSPLAAHPRAMLGAVLAGMVACAFVLDAFEMIFLVVPIVMPPLLTVVPMRLGRRAHAARAATRLSPAAARLRDRHVARRAARVPPLRALARALAPQLAAQTLLIVALLAWPAPDAPRPRRGHRRRGGAVSANRPSA